MKRRKTSLTPNQRLAIHRRRQARSIRDSLSNIERGLLDPKIPPNYRATVANALVVLLQGGHVFPIACVKAFLACHANPVRIDPDAYWAFVAAQERRFHAMPDYERYSAWDAPDYELPEAESKGGAVCR